MTGAPRRGARGSFCPMLMPGPRVGLRVTSSQRCLKPLPNEADLGEYCRKRGIYPAQIVAWRAACEQANDWDRSSSARISQATKEEKKRVKDLERDLVRKDRALAETAALLVLRKKAAAIWVRIPRHVATCSTRMWPVIP